MRLSLSVPDALWLQASEAYRLATPSRLVQSALETLLSDGRPDDLQGPPSGSRDRLVRVQERLRDEARALYESGYQAGLDLADVLDWWVVEQLSSVDWRLDRLPRSPRTSPVLDELRDQLGRHRPGAETLLGEVEQGDAGRLSTFASGMVAALRDCLAAPPPAVEQ